VAARQDPGDAEVATGEPVPRPEPTGSAEPGPREAAGTSHASSSVVSGLREIRDVSRACVSHRQLLDEGAARCMCRAVCAHRFEGAVREEGGSVEVRLPFREVDGLSFSIQGGGTVSWCRYADPGGLDVSVRCGEDDGGAPGTLEGTSIPDTADNRRVIDFMERYRAALESRDAEAVLALASERYLDDGGTASPTDDVSHDDLRNFMARWMASVREVRFDVRYHTIHHDPDRTRVQMTYEATFTLDTAPPRTQRRVDRTEVVLEREGDGFRILSGM